MVQNRSTVGVSTHFPIISFLLTGIRRHNGVPPVLMFNQNFSKASPRDPYSMLKVIHEALCADSPVALQAVIFCTDQLDEFGKDKSGMTSTHMLL
jgi:hypothetical protein